MLKVARQSLSFEKTCQLLLATDGAAKPSHGRENAGVHDCLFRGSVARQAVRDVMALQPEKVMTTTQGSGAG